MPEGDKVLYLTFDDGPHPSITTEVLDTLKIYNAKGTFFCVGANVKKYPEVYSRIIEEGHSVGNHTMHHLNGSKVNDRLYLEDIREAKKYIDSNLFRPPYGRLSSFLAKQLAGPAYNFKIVMWSVLSADFDPEVSKEDCLNNVILNATDGSIIVFHDSKKATDKILFALPEVLAYFTKKGFTFKSLQESAINNTIKQPEEIEE